MKAGPDTEDSAFDGRSPMGDIEGRIVNPPPNEITLFLSGGGMRSALSGIGAIAYLRSVGRWNDVSAVVSVSGGAFTNVALAAAGDTEPDRALRGLYQRLTRHPPLLGHLRTISGLIVMLVGWLAAVRLATRHHGSRPITVIVVALVILGLIGSVTDGRRAAIIHVALAVVCMAVVMASYRIEHHRRTHDIVLGVGLLGVVLVGLFLTLMLYNGDRMRFIVGPLPTTWDAATTGGRLHVFAASELADGAPMYFTVKDGLHRVYRSMLGLEQHSSIDLPPRELTGLTLTPMQTLTASVALPGLLPPLVKRHDNRPLFLSDGGIHGTLSSRLDPFVNQTYAGPKGDLRELAALHDVGIGYHSVIVDGGKFSRPAGWTRLAEVPIIGRAVDIGRALVVSLDALITVNRDEALVEATTHPGSFHWYLRTTGSGVTDRFSQWSRDDALARRVVDLRTRGDRVGLLSGFGEHGRACVESAALLAWLSDRYPTATTALCPESLAEFDRWFDGWLNGPM